MGESFGIWEMGNDEAIFPHIDMANLACGFHASDSLHMDKSVQLAKRYDVAIGAHVAYQDLQGFGRRSILCSYDEIKTKVIYQIGALNGFCKAYNTKITYVKPHGALYNDMMKDLDIFRAICDGISSIDNSLSLMILSIKDTTRFEQIAQEFGLNLIYEVFADRNYDSNGFLVSRSNKDAVIHNINEITKRIQQLNKKGTINTISGEEISIKADTICIHGDNPKALDFIKEIKKHL
jgi:UPF0271 protein